MWNAAADDNVTILGTTMDSTAMRLKEKLYIRHVLSFKKEGILNVVTIFHVFNSFLTQLKVESSHSRSSFFIM
jgi:hypothetical protein